MKRTIQRVVSMVLVGAMTSSVCAFATIINNTAGTISA